MNSLIVGISGATGAIYGIRLLEALSIAGVESHLVITEAAEKTISLETGREIEEVKSLASVVYDIDDIAAAIASGSFQTGGMVVLPCSIKSLSAIANSYNVNLLVRAADVTIKEGRKLVLAVRETPLHKGHLEQMIKLAAMGVVILPPLPAFYFHPKSIDDIIDHSIGKILDQFGIRHDLFQRWGGAGRDNQGG
ncbi:MAG: UbiX family flavin prenyltransferase [Smithellaceae bacterium]|nr:UbiX family flavin prenyltransferase [Smithellaceae bacterium]